MIPELKVFLIAMSPFFELRGSIPVALTIYHMGVVESFIISFLGNLIPAFFLVSFLGPISRWLSKNFAIFERFFSWFFKRTERNNNFLVKKYGSIALALFVAIPLPVTGAWTGSVVAFLFNIPFKKAFPSIALGIFLAGVIVTFATKGGIVIESYFGWPALLGALLLIGLLIKVKKNKL